jgi:peptidoglycan/xylan/chitin deacetylase (PgdA/CDA1 family)
MPFRVAFTFDTEHPDRPHHEPGGVTAILNTLAAEDTRATFFLQGRWVESEPDAAEAIARAGHLIGSHSYYHTHMDLLSDAGFRTDVDKAECAIRQHVGTDPRPWLRFPFGSAGNDSGRLDHLRVDLLPKLGYRHVGWHVEANDWLTRATACRMAALIVGGAKEHGDGAIVLLHTWSPPVAAAVAIAVRELTDAGATFVRVDELDLPPGLQPIAETGSRRQRLSREKGRHSEAQP